MVVITDRVSDFIIRLKNAGRIKHESVTLPHSNLIEMIAKKLRGIGLIGSIKVLGDTPATKRMIVELKYNESGLHMISDVKRISKPSRRVYYKVKDLHPVKSNKGSLIVSTPKGILTGYEARKECVGGEALFLIW